MDSNHRKMIKLTDLHKKAKFSENDMRELGIKTLQLEADRPFTDSEKAQAMQMENRLSTLATPAAPWSTVLKAILGAICKLTVDEFSDIRLAIEFKAICKLRNAMLDGKWTVALCFCTQRRSQTFQVGPRFYGGL